jgi:hypothetical protein
LRLGFLPYRGYREHGKSGTILRSLDTQIFVDVEVIDGNPVFWDFVLEQSWGVDAKRLYEAGNLGSIDSHTLFQSKDEPGGESEEWRRKVPFCWLKG